MSTNHSSQGFCSQTVVLLLAWLAVGLPLAWGVTMTITKALALFR